jgi:undecaprenyl pyrophosphate synthase
LSCHFMAQSEIPREPDTQGLQCGLGGGRQGALIGAACNPADRLHVAIIMDGNGRWAARRGLARACGHREGARAVRRTVQAALSQDIGTLTLFAFSGDNWQRPDDEVNTLMRIFQDYLV